MNSLQPLLSLPTLDYFTPLRLTPPLALSAGSVVVVVVRAGKSVVGEIALAYPITLRQVRRHPLT